MESVIYNGKSFREVECSGIEVLNSKNEWVDIEIYLQEVKTRDGSEINRIYNIEGSIFGMTQILKTFEDEEKKFKLGFEAKKLKIEDRKPESTKKERGLIKRGGCVQLYIYSVYISSCESEEKALELRSWIMNKVKEGRTLESLKKEIKSTKNEMRNIALGKKQRYEQ